MKNIILFDGGRTKGRDLWVLGNCAHVLSSLPSPSLTLPKSLLPVHPQKLPGTPWAYMGVPPVQEGTYNVT